MADSIHRIRTASVTRLANGTLYTANDALSNHATTPTILTFSGVAKNAGGGGIIRGVTLHKSDPDQVGAAFDLYFFDTTVAVAGFKDNLVIAITDAEWRTCIGGVEFLAADAVNVVTGDLWVQTNLDMPYQCAGGLKDIYAVPVVRGGYTPGSAEVFTFRVLLEID